jgi:hypothetical protein
VIGLDVPLAVLLPGEEVTVKRVTGEPPSLCGVKLIVAWPLPAVAVTPIGGAGTVGAAVGTTVFDGDEIGPGPAALVALTVNV